jgi:hypothetical protein
VIMYAIDFEKRSDGGPSLIGPFGSETAAQRWVTGLNLNTDSFETNYTIRPMHVPDLLGR